MKLTMQLIPKTSWSENLRSMIGRARWDTLRKEVLSQQGNVCRICGSSRKLQCHEVWVFDDEAEVQRLEGFKAMCSLCHLVQHFGLAQRLSHQGHVDLENVIGHFMAVNGVSREEFEDHKIAAFSTWCARSQVQWKVDLGEWAALVSSKD